MGKRIALVAAATVVAATAFTTAAWAVLGGTWVAYCVFIYYGNPSEFGNGGVQGCTPPSPGGVDQSGTNLIGLSDLRYDTSQYVGGTFYDTYAHALTLVGTTPIIRASLVLDSGWGGDQRLTLTSATVGTAADSNTFTPSPATALTPTCNLPPATIRVTKTSGTGSGDVNEPISIQPNDTNGDFRTVDCKYMYNLATASLPGRGRRRPVQGRGPDQRHDSCGESCVLRHALGTAGRSSTAAPRLRGRFALRETSAMERRLISGTGAYEPIVGYSRAVVAGDRVHVSGTAANPPDGSPPPEDVYDQTLLCLDLIGTALEQAGTSLENVVRTRVYLTSADDFDGFARAHAEVFGGVRPANTTVLAGLFDPAWKVEIEVEAVAP
jgi:enamine deaminase RidA (YjgF/YER057c/UK114 family)